MTYNDQTYWYDSTATSKLLLKTDKKNLEVNNKYPESNWLVFRVRLWGLLIVSFKFKRWGWFIDKSAGIRKTLDFHTILFFSWGK